MGLNKWMERKMKNLHWTDISLVKISVFAFALMVAKLYAPLLGLEWYWYGLIFVIAAIKPCYKMFR